MQFNNVQFIKSAADKKGFIAPDKPMIVVCGKSNVGKSSFINMLAGRRKLARTSTEPGRTRLINYFDFEYFILADLPGYGYARVSKTEKERWAVMLNDFFSEKEQIAHVFSLVDMRHNPTADDLQMINFLYAQIIPFTVAATKCDKLPKTKQKPRLREIAAILKMGEADIIPVSSTEGKGREEIIAKIQQIIKNSI